MKARWLFVPLAILLAAVWCYIATHSKRAAPGPAAATQIAQAPAPALASPPLAASPTPADDADAMAGSPLAAELNTPGGDGLHDVQPLHALIRQYLRILHHRQGPPIGDDTDLAHVLTGHNPMRLIFVPPGNPALSADGHLRDRWGTPYFIHALGYGTYEVRSAGPDRKLFTTDDLVDGPGGQTIIPEQ